MKKSTALKPICLDTPPPGADSLLRYCWSRLDEVPRRVAWGNYRSSGVCPTGIEILQGNFVCRFTDGGVNEEWSHVMAHAWMADIVTRHARHERERRITTSRRGGKAKGKAKIGEARAQLLEPMFADKRLRDEHRSKLKYRSQGQEAYSREVCAVFGTWLKDVCEHDAAKTLADQCLRRGHWQTIRQALDSIGRLPKPQRT